MNGHKALSRCHKIQQSPFLRSRNGIVIGIHQHHVVVMQGLRVQRARIIGVGNAYAIRAKRCSNRRGVRLRVMMSAFVAEE